MADPDGPPGVRGAGASYMTLGLQLGLSVVAFLFLGRWLDGKFGTDPWLMLAGLALGATGGLIAFLKQAADMGKSEDEEEARRRKDRGA